MRKTADQEQGLADRLVELSELARAVGRTVQADRFLLLAWTAFEGSELSSLALEPISVGHVAPHGMQAFTPTEIGSYASQQRQAASGC